MTVFPRQWTIVSLLKSHRCSPFSTMCPSLWARGSIKWTSLKTMQRTHGFDATWLWYWKWPLNTMTSYINRRRRHIHQLYHAGAHFTETPRAKTRASLGRNRRACTIAVVIGENDDCIWRRKRLLMPACVGRGGNRCRKCKAPVCPHQADGYQVGTVLLMAQTCKTEEHRLLFNVTQWGSGRVVVA